MRKAILLAVGASVVMSTAFARPPHRDYRDCRHREYRGRGYERYEHRDRDYGRHYEWRGERHEQHWHHDQDRYRYHRH